MDVASKQTPPSPQARPQGAQESPPEKLTPESLSWLRSKRWTVCRLRAVGYKVSADGEGVAAHCLACGWRGEEV